MRLLPSTGWGVRENGSTPTPSPAPSVTTAMPQGVNRRACQHNERDEDRWRDPAQPPIGGQGGQADHATHPTIRTIRHASRLTRMVTSSRSLDTMADRRAWVRPQPSSRATDCHGPSDRSGEPRTSPGRCTARALPPPLRRTHGASRRAALEPQRQSPDRRRPRLRVQFERFDSCRFSFRVTRPCSHGSAGSHRPPRARGRQETPPQ